jgi:hypothetical protein
MREKEVHYKMHFARSGRLGRVNCIKIIFILLLAFGIIMLLSNIYLVIASVPLYLLIVWASFSNMIILISYSLLKEEYYSPNCFGYFKAFFFLGILASIGLGVYFSIQIDAILVYIFTSLQVTLTFLILLLGEIEKPYIFKCLVCKKKKEDYERF